MVVLIPALFLAGCSAAPTAGIKIDTAATGTGTRGTADPAPWYTPRPVAGVESCSAIPQQRSDRETGADGLPALTLPCLTSGPAIDLSMMTGRPVLVNVWASWCGPCRDEMPLLQSNYERYGDAVGFVGVDTKDSPDGAAEFLKEVGATYPQLVDGDGQLLKDLRIPGVPVTVVIDAEGRIAGKHIGPLTQASIDDLLASVR